MGSTFLVDLIVFKKGNRPEDKYFDYQVNFGDGVIEFFATQDSGDPKTLNCTSMEYSRLEKQCEKDYVDIEVNKFHIHYHSIRLNFLEDEEIINRFVILYKGFLELNKNQMTHPRVRQVSKCEEGLTEPKKLSMAKIETPEVSESKVINSQRKAILISDDEFLVNLTVTNKNFEARGLPAKT
uniref:MATH domain-containing protein n=1 Tax=Caenorhabditis tropicalis TaxID=1561998 RepID=A0A1I7UR52_9PELO